MKTLKIEEHLHKELKIYCVNNNITISNLIDRLIKKEIRYDNNKKSEDKNPQQK